MIPTDTPVERFLALVTSKVKKTQILSGVFQEATPDRSNNDSSFGLRFLKDLPPFFSLWYQQCELLFFKASA